MQADRHAAQLRSIALIFHGIFPFSRDAGGFI
jgi:hypothetical protein